MSKSPDGEKLIDHLLNSSRFVFDKKTTQRLRFLHSLHFSPTRTPIHIQHRGSTMERPPRHVRFIRGSRFLFVRWQKCFFPNHFWQQNSDRRMFQRGLLRLRFANWYRRATRVDRSRAPDHTGREGFNVWISLKTSHGIGLSPFLLPSIPHCLIQVSVFSRRRRRPFVSAVVSARRGGIPPT